MLLIVFILFIFFFYFFFLGVQELKGGLTPTLSLERELDTQSLIFNPSSNSFQSLSIVGCGSAYPPVC